MSNGIVVEHKENGVRYAISESNYNPKVHKKVRDLKPGETVRGYQPRSKESLGDHAGGGDTDAVPSPNKTEGSAPAASQEKEGK